KPAAQAQPKWRIALEDANWKTPAELTHRRGRQRQTGTPPKPRTSTTDASHAAGRVGAPRRGARQRPSPWNAPALPCYRARRGGGRDAGGIGPVHRRARRRAPTTGNAKTHSTPSHDDGVEHKPRHHIRRRLRRAARCVGAIAAAPAEHACTQRHRSVLLHARARARHPSLGAAVRAPTGPAWSPSSSPPQRERVKARGERSAPVDGKWREC
ncbi:hypothetical protein Ctob_009650, partial [Chrysochromulina tobinii]